MHPHNVTSSSLVDKSYTRPSNWDTFFSLSLRLAPSSLQYPCSIIIPSLRESVLSGENHSPRRYGNYLRRPLMGNLSCSLIYPRYCSFCSTLDWLLTGCSLVCISFVCPEYRISVSHFNQSRYAERFFSCNRSKTSTQRLLFLGSLQGSSESAIDGRSIRRTLINILFPAISHRWISS